MSTPDLRKFEVDALNFCKQFELFKSLPTLQKGLVRAQYAGLLCRGCLNKIIICILYLSKTGFLNRAET